MGKCLKKRSTKLAYVEEAGGNQETYNINCSLPNTSFLYRFA